MLSKKQRKASKRSMKKDEKRPETDIKIFLKKKQEKNVSIIGIEIKIFLKKKSKRKLNI